MLRTAPLATAALPCVSSADPLPHEVIEDPATQRLMLGDIPVYVSYVLAGDEVIVEGVVIGEDYAEASCFAGGQLSVWRSAIEQRIRSLCGVA